MICNDDMMSNSSRQRCMKSEQDQTMGEREKRKTGCIPFLNAKEADRVSNMAKNHGRW